MKYHVLVEDDHHEVTVEPRGGRLEVTLDGETVVVDVATLADGRAYSLLLDDRSVDVSVEEDGDNLSLLIGGHRFDTEVMGEREWLARSISQQQDGGDNLVRAVMTGLVRDVLVAPGDAVVTGQVLLILEAMKMENEVKAEVDGTVKAVSVTSGATVNRGDVLAEIE